MGKEKLFLLKKTTPYKLGISFCLLLLIPIWIYMLVPITIELINNFSIGMVFVFVLIFSLIIPLLITISLYKNSSIKITNEDIIWSYPDLKIWKKTVKSISVSNVNSYDKKDNIIFLFNDQPKPVLKIFIPKQTIDKDLLMKQITKELESIGIMRKNT